MAMVKIVKKCMECGSEYEIRREFASRNEADNFEKWAESQEGKCKACYAKEQTAKAQNNVPAEFLPELEGSEKQIAWAESIRAKYYAKLVRNKIQWNLLITSTDQDIITAVKSMKTTSAKFWIDARGCYLTSRVHPMFLVD